MRIGQLAVTFLVKHRDEKVESLVFFLTHDSSVGIGLIALTKEMKDAMDKDTAQFDIERHIERKGIVGHTFDTNHNIARDKIRGNIVEGDDVGIGVVAEVLLVDLEEVLVGTEEVVDVTDTCAAVGDDSSNPRREVG